MLPQLLTAMRLSLQKKKSILILESRSNGGVGRHARDIAISRNNGLARQKLGSNALDIAGGDLRIKIKSIKRHRAQSAIGRREKIYLESLLSQKAWTALSEKPCFGHERRGHKRVEAEV